MGLARQTGFVLALVLAASAPSFAATGGPDSAGYTWRDSDEPGVGSTRPSFRPTDLRGQGFTGDEALLRLNLPWSFPFYGGSYNALWLSANGWLSFGDPLGQAHPNTASIPASTPPHALVAFLWDDWTLETPSPEAWSGPTTAGDGYQVLVKFGRKSDPTQYTTVAATLFITGAIRFDYVDRSAAIEGPATMIGIENLAGSVGFGLPYMTAGTPAGGARFRNGYSVLYLPSPRLDCTAPTRIACGQPTATYSNAAGSNRVQGYNCSPATFAGNERVFELTLARMSDVTVTLGNLAGRNLSLFLLEGCNEIADCWQNATPALSRSFVGAGTYYLVVDGATALDNGDFTLDVACQDTAVQVPCGATLVGESTVGRTNQVTNWTCLPAQTAPERFYEVTATAPTTLTASLSNTSVPGMSVLVSDTSTFTPTTRTCVGSSPASVTVYGAGGSSLVTVDGTGGTGGTYDLSIACSRLDCPDPMPVISVQSPAPVIGDTTGGTSSADSYYCEQSAFGAAGNLTGYTGPEHVYQFTLTVPMVVSFFFDAASPDMRLLILRDCYEGSCILEGGCAENLAPGTYYLVVDGRNGAEGSYSITPLALPAAAYKRYWECPECSTTGNCAGSGCTNPGTVRDTTFEFCSGNFCGTCCDFSLFAVVECGTEFHIPFRDVESGTIRIRDVFRQQFVNLSARNDSTICPYFDSGTQVGWYDVGCQPNPRPACPVPKTGGGFDCRTDRRIMDVSFQGTPTVCGVYELQFIDWGGYQWQVFANCTGTGVELYNLYRDMCSALASYKPRPEVGIVAVTPDDLRCSSRQASGTITLENLGCAPVVGVEIVIEDDPRGTGLPKTIPVNLLPGQRASVPWTYDLTVQPADLTFRVDPAGRTEECSEALGSTVRCGANPTTQRTVVSSNCPAICRTQADAGPPATICADEPHTLDGSASLLSCVLGGTAQYRWEDAADPLNVFCDWSGTATCALAPGRLPAGFNLARLRVRCQNNLPTCESNATTLLEVVANILPPGVGNVLRSFKAGDDVVLSWASILTSPISGYRLYKDFDRRLPSGSRALLGDLESAATTTTDGGAVSGLPRPVAYYQAVGISCAGDLEGPY